MANEPVIVAGAGSWGTALSLVLARNHHRVYLWGHDPAHVDRLREDRVNRQYLPDIPIPEAVIPVTSLQQPLQQSRAVVIAVPCSGLADVLKQLLPAADSGLRICLACKGLASGAELLNHEVVRQVLGDTGTAVLSGPSFASEVAREMPTAVTVASADPGVADYFAGYFHNEVFRVYTSEDIIGVQIGGAVKNVMAIASGISDGLGFGANTRAALITRGLAEIMRFGVKVGGKPQTFMGLAGLGDLVLTCTDDQSRNRRLGLALARGETLEAARRSIGQAIEGARTAGELVRLAQRYAVDMPISEQVNRVLTGQSTPRAAVQSLLNRDPRTEEE